MQVLHAQTVYLHSDNPQMRWKLKPQAEVGTDVKSLCENGYNVSAWVDAVVPGTAFNSYVIAGLEKDPNFGDNIHQVNRDKYDRSFWYRTTFRVPADFTKELIWLNFNGVNRFGAAYPFAYAVSITPCSLSLTDTGLPQCPHVHAFSHSAGQTLDVNSGKLLVLCRRLYACSQLPVYTRSFHSGTRLCRGQPDVMPAIVIPDWQKGTPQSIQRAACFC